MSKESQEVKFAEFVPSLAMDKLLQIYEEAMDNKIDVDSEDHEEIWLEFSEAVTGCIWKIVFTAKSLSKEDSDKASALLKKYRDDAGFINPTFYNKWIYTFRDELLKKEVLDFWKNEVVAKELGPLWARDCDFFDKSDDPEPVKFYQHAGCEAPWLKAKKPVAEPLNLFGNTAASPKSPGTAASTASLRKISLDNALADYKNNMEAQNNIDPDDEEAFTKIFTEVREVLWKLLFNESSLSDAKLKQAAELLLAYKKDACFQSPYQYNDWIVTVRDELIKRKYVDFWKIVVNQELGLIGAKESDYFDDMEDPKIPEFYTIGNEKLTQEKK
ncbi:uncharacterized protein LOC101899517 [Musca domestica]|uniref:Uncharacterized protein LOC101899517 n=1 Tax=Musca domestica TaxID=7370 RepID=A0A1I8MJF1_MUSDO|nr:uncharacterized protein LOC101899517 [Musca domestica]